MEIGAMAGSAALRFPLGSRRRERPGCHSRGSGRGDLERLEPQCRRVPGRTGLELARGSGFPLPAFLLWLVWWSGAERREDRNRNGVGREPRPKLRPSIRGSR